jgi:hypothetical protein
MGVVGRGWSRPGTCRTSELSRRRFIDEVVEEEELHVAIEVVEQGEEVRIAVQHVAERAGGAGVVAADALQREIHTVGDLAGEPAVPDISLIDDNFLRRFQSTPTLRLQI